MAARALPSALLRSLSARPKAQSTSLKLEAGPSSAIRSEALKPKSEIKGIAELEPRVDTSEAKLRIQVSVDRRPAGINKPALSDSSLATPVADRDYRALHAVSSPVSASVSNQVHPLGFIPQALLNPHISTIFSSFAILMVGVLDYVSGPHLSLAIMYLLPVIFAAWFAGKNNGMLVAVLASLVWVTADVASFPPAPNFGVALWNVSSRLAVFAFVVLLLARIRGLQAGLEDTIAQRTRQLEVETARCIAMEREVAAVSTREQQRIAHELHDGLGQELGGLAFHAKVLAAKLEAGGVPHSSEAERLVSLLNQSISRTRSLSNLLDPVGCESGGLLHALEQLAERSGGVFEMACIFNGPAKLPGMRADAELDLYRIAQEAIHNASQHGKASEVRMHIGLEPGALVLSVMDNGCGFDPAGIINGKDRGMGLRIMRYRASGLAARLAIDSAPGRGCTIRCTLPV
jgi:signal transduction histidine kinase